MGITTDPNDPTLKRGHDEKPSAQAEKYLVLSEEDRAKGFVRPFRDKYVHSAPTLIARCGALTSMGRALAETHARDPKFYGSTYCVGCSMHRPVAEFTWDGTDEKVGS
jgi:hypothetical protein